MKKSRVSFILEDDSIITTKEGGFKINNKINKSLYTHLKLNFISIIQERYDLTFCKAYQISVSGDFNLYLIDTAISFLKKQNHELN